MKPKENFRKWIFLVLLLIISVTFLFLQLLSFKAIDSTVRNNVLFFAFIYEIMLLYINFFTIAYDTQ